MRNKSKKDALSVVIGFVILICLLGLCILFYVKHKYEIEEDREKRLQFQAKSVEEYVESKLIPKGCYALTKEYNGNISENELYRSLDIFQKYLIELDEKIDSTSQQNIQEYFDKNSKIINEKIGINSVEDFTEIVKKVKSMEGNIADFKYAKVQKESYKRTAKYLQFKIDFVYNNEVIVFDVHYMNDINASNVAEFYAG